MNFLSNLFRSAKNERQDQRNDEVRNATHSNDLQRMLDATQLQTNPIDKHFLLLNIVRETYKRRKEKKYRDICIRYSQIHINEFYKFSDPLEKDIGRLPHVPTFEYYATILTEDGQFEKAIEICGLAIIYGLDDGTKTGYQGRIQRIKKKME